MTSIQIEMSIAAIVLFIIIITSLKRSTISVKSSIAWMLLPVVFLLIAIFPSPLEELSKWLGFENFSNFIFVIMIGLLLVLCFFLTIATSRQQDQINKLIQEISLLKHKKPKTKN